MGNDGDQEDELEPDEPFIPESRRHLPAKERVQISRVLLGQVQEDDGAAVIRPSVYKGIYKRCYSNVREKKKASKVLVEKV